MGRKEPIKKQIFLDNLPRWESGINIGNINWSLCKGYFVHFIYDGIEGKVEIVDYNNGKLRLKYNDNYMNSNLNDFKNCSLGKILGKITSSFKIEIGTRFQDDKRDITITDRKCIQEEKIDKKGRKCIANRKYYKYKCNKCEFDCGKHWDTKEKVYKEELWMEEANLLGDKCGNNSKGCSCCCGFSNIVVEGINDIYTTDKWLISIINDDEFCKTHTHGSNDEIYPTCLDCGRKRNKKMKIRTIYKQKSIRCSCGDGVSYPSKFMFNILEQLDIDFETEYAPKWISPKRYDFYIPSMNLIIEMDGGFHTNDNNMSGITKEESHEVDTYKDEQAELHGIEVIRINCDYEYNDRFEFIKNNILNYEKMNKYFDLSKIDWLKTEEFACSNLVKVACQYWNDKKYSIKEIATIMKLSDVTIRTYLKQGTSNILNWCNYNGEEELTKNGKAKGKSVEIFKDGISQGIFESISELARQSKKLFGVKLFNGRTSEVCNGKTPQYKGFTIQFV